MIARSRLIAFRVCAFGSLNSMARYAESKKRAIEAHAAIGQKGRAILLITHAGLTQMEMGDFRSALPASLIRGKKGSAASINAAFPKTNRRRASASSCPLGH